MLLPKKTCMTCQLVTRDPEALKRLFHSRAYYRKGETPTKFAEAYGIKPKSVLNHVKHHQFLKKALYEREKLHREQSVEKARVDGVSSRDQETIAPPIRTRGSSTDDVWQEVIDSGLEALREGKLRFTASDLLKAAKDKEDISLKRKSQDLDILKTIAYFASGESEPNANRTKLFEGKDVQDYDPTLGVTGDDQESPDRPGAVRQRLPGDGPTSWPDQILNQLTPQ